MDCRFDYSSTVRSAGDYGAHLNTPKTLEECEALCDAHPECASFVVDQMGVGKCHLRTECPLVNEDCIEASSWGFINYVKEDCEASAPTSLPDDLPSTMNPVVTSVYKKTDCRFDYSSTVRSAGDYGAHLNTPKTLEECEALCDAHPECASFVVDQMGGGKCHLRTECPLVNEACIEASSW